MSEQERAIAFFENLVNHDAEAWGCEQEIPNFRIALAALREKQEREKGCEYCKQQSLLLKDDDCADVVKIMLAKNGTGSHYLDDYRDGRFFWAVKIAFCPMCGRKLEVKQDVSY